MRIRRPCGDSGNRATTGLNGDDEFRDFTFTNAARMWSSTNPDFFKGTVVEREAAKVLGAETPVRRPQMMRLPPSGAMRRRSDPVKFRNEGKHETGCASERSAAACFLSTNERSSLSHQHRQSSRCPVFGDVAVALWHLLVPKYSHSARVGGRAISRVVVLHVPRRGGYPAHPHLLAIVVELLRCRINHIDLPQLQLGVINVLGQTGIVLLVDVVDAATITVAGGELRATADVVNVHVARLPVAPRGLGEAEHSVIVGQRGG